MELNLFIIRRVQILVVKIDPTRRMEYQKNFLERRHTERYTRFHNYRIHTLEDDQVCYLTMIVSLIVIDASPVAAPDPREVPDLLSACARMDSWGLSDVAKALCGAVGNCLNSQGRPVCSCSRSAPGTVGGIGCDLLGKK